MLVHVLFWVTVLAERALGTEAGTTQCASHGECIGYTVANANHESFDGAYVYVSATGGVPEHWKHEQNQGYLVQLAGSAGWALVFPSGDLGWPTMGYPQNWDALNGNAHAYTQSADPTLMWLCWSGGDYTVEKALVSLTPPPTGATKQCIAKMNWITLKF